MNLVVELPAFYKLGKHLIVGIIFLFDERDIYLDL